MIVLLISLYVFSILGIGLSVYLINDSRKLSEADEAEKSNANEAAIKRKLTVATRLLGPSIALFILAMIIRIVAKV